MADSFGTELGRRLHADHRPVLLARALPHLETTITEVRLQHPTHERSDPLTPADTFVAALQLIDFPVHKWWEDGKPAPITGLKAGQLSLYDLTRDPRFTINNPFHSIHVELPRTLLDAIADGTGAPRIAGLDYTPGAGIDDPVFRHLTLALRPSFAHPEQSSRLFVDSVTMAIAEHIATTYGRLRPSGRQETGGLSSWQARRATDLIDARLAGDLTVAQLAAHCGLSASHFTQAFRKSTGVTPHRWLMLRRVAKAKDLLRGGAHTLAEVALACGFAHQSHFTRAFGAITGCPPGEWRRRSQSRRPPRSAANS